jgi:hypothetical protein
LVALFTGVVSFQSDGGRWRDVTRDFRLEAHDESIAIREDASMIRDIARSAPLEFRAIWARIRYSITALHASAKAETRVAETYISPRRRDQ